MIGSFQVSSNINILYSSEADSLFLSTTILLF